MKRLYEYDRPVEFGEGRIYRYEGRLIEMLNPILCQDCTTPTIWFDDDEDGNPIVGQLYHDATCIQVRTGQGEVAPTLAEQKEQRVPAVVRVKRYVREHPDATVQDIAVGSDTNERTVRKALGLNR